MHNISKLHSLLQGKKATQIGVQFDERSRHIVHAPAGGATAGSNPAPSCEFIEVEFRKRANS